MATVAALPNALHDKIAAVAGKITRLRLTRRIAGTVLMLGVTLGLLVLADVFLKFGTGIRFALLAGWCTLAVVGIIACVKAIGRRADVDALAALIEKEYPNLAERLTSSVELAEAGEKGHGSQALIQLLIRETEIRASKLNFLQAAPESGTYSLAGIAGVVLLILAIPAVVVPQTFFGQARRFFAPWTVAPV